MRDQTRRQLRLFCALGILIILAFLALFLIGGTRTMWVGRTDLTVVFVVTDVDTGRAIEGAEVAVHSYGGLYADKDEKQFRLRTDANGAASDICRNSMCSGQSSSLWSRSTYAVHMPWWRVTVTAPGHASTEPFYLPDHPHRTFAHRTAPGQSKVAIPIGLRKSP